MKVYSFPKIIVFFCENYPCFHHKKKINYKIKQSDSIPWHCLTISSLSSWKFIATKDRTIQQMPNFASLIKMLWWLALLHIRII